MQLKRYRVRNFRSVRDSGWLEVDRVTALIGVNESGKTNLLLPLWKLNPATDGQIQPTSDYPKSLFGDIRAHPGDFEFITAEFELDESQASTIANMAKIELSSASVVAVTRFFDGSYAVEFPNHKRENSISGRSFSADVVALKETISEAAPLKGELDFVARLSDNLNQIIADIRQCERISASEYGNFYSKLSNVLPESPARTSVIVPLLQRLLDSMREQSAVLNLPSPGEIDEVFNYVLGQLPKFVYYSNYGNLDSEIYLPHVVDNLERSDLGTKEAAKVRTLKVLFQFVKLQPKEILELGQDFRDPTGRAPTPEEVEAIAEQKRIRSILLQSAGASLTEKFKVWWKQGDYRFRFEADGNHFRIWVSDDRRPQDVELENRSTGLQWFLSFYLVFLVESIGAHKGAIILLDEPGMSLHPLAQRNLSGFFESLAEKSQIVYTSHSPFLVDADRLERARKVFVAEDGFTQVTSDLRQAGADEASRGASYAVHSALNLSVAESLLLGCEPVIVEGASDQIYLSAIKSLLLSAGLITPKRELVFTPSGGAKTARIIAGILTGRDESLPFVLFDADDHGKKAGVDLSQSLYSGSQEKILYVNSFVALENAQIEDLVPGAILADELDRIFRAADVRFSDLWVDGKDFVSQVRVWASSHGVELTSGWKVDLAKRFKRRALQMGVSKFDQGTLDRWARLFKAFSPTSD